MLQSAKREGYSESLQKMNFLFIDSTCDLLPVTHSPSSWIGSPCFLWETTLLHVQPCDFSEPGTPISLWAHMGLGKGGLLTLGLQ